MITSEKLLSQAFKDWRSDPQIARYIEAAGLCGTSTAWLNIMGLAFDAGAMHGTRRTMERVCPSPKDGEA